MLNTIDFFNHYFISCVMTFALHLNSLKSFKITPVGKMKKLGSYFGKDTLVSS